VCQDGAGSSDLGVSTMYGSCWRDFMKWVYRAYDMTDDSWEPAGKFDACNIAKPFAKVVNSVYLICHGLSDYAGAATCRQWHSTADYRDLLVTAENRFHGPYYVRFIQYNGSRPADAEIRRFLARDRTNLHCPLFNVGSTYDTPTFRAAALLHEAWHHWQYENDFDPSHMSCAVGDCDWYYVNKSSPWGHMHTYDLNAASFRFLSPYQVMVEFLDDISIFHRKQVPISTALDARNEGNAVLTEKFRNAPKFRIGAPKPFPDW
jgi:hypothetical protein